MRGASSVRHGDGTRCDGGAWGLVRLVVKVREVHGVINGHAHDHHDQNGDVGVELEVGEEGRGQHPRDRRANREHGKDWHEDLPPPPVGWGRPAIKYIWTCEERRSARPRIRVT